MRSSSSRERGGTFVPERERLAEHLGIEGVTESSVRLGLDPVGELIDVETADPLPVQPVELLAVVAGCRVGDPIEVERSHQRGPVEHFVSVVTRRPTEQRDVVHQRFRQVAAVAEVLQRDRAVTFGELGAGRGVDDERKVRIDRARTVVERHAGPALDGWSPRDPRPG